MEEKKTFKQGLGMIMRGHVICAKRTSEGVNGFVMSNPWGIVIGVIVVSVILSAVWMVHCRTNQVTAEWQRDSLEQRCETLEISLGVRK